jgi:DNA polymerase III subunit delta
VKNFNEIIASVKKKSFAPIYFLQGDEAFFIDEISNAIEQYCLEEHERDFNQTILYGKDIKEFDEIIAIAKKYPMMAERQLVVVKEAQNLSKSIEKLLDYSENPLKTTVLVFCYKYQTIKGTTKLYKSLSKSGVIFNSDKIKDYHLPQWIEAKAKELNILIQPKESALLAEFLGTDLSKVVLELEKLKLILEPNQKVTPEIIEKNIGISKDFNVFELTSALANKDYSKISRIANYAANNTKSMPLLLLIPTLYGYFAKVMKLHFSKNKNNDAEIARELKINPFFVREYKLAAHNYPPKNVSRIVSELKTFDLKIKGIGYSSTDEGELIKELLFKISH